MKHTSVTVHIGGDHYFMTFLYEGLLRLQRQQGLTVRLVRSFKARDSQRSHNLILSLDIKRREQHRRICFDLADNPNQFSMSALNEHELYFKRSYLASAGRQLSPECKVRPWGPMFSCRYGTMVQAMANIICSLANAQESVTLQHKLGQFYNYIKLTSLDEYEKIAQQAHDGRVLFQTRAWHSGNYQNWREINESRVGVIRALKRQFGKRFVGGFIPDATSQKYYADALSSFPSSRRRYLALIRQAQVCVYTRGLFDSPAFKLAEYLAAGRCIVAEPILVNFTAPLQEGRHYLSFTDPDQCVQRCEMLLQNQTMAQEMMKNNAQYYANHVDPSRQMSRAIELALGNDTENHETAI